jgi:hypothetical protein
MGNPLGFYYESDREGDFIILGPTGGVLVLEVRMYERFTLELMKRFAWTVSRRSEYRTEVTVDTERAEPQPNRARRRKSSQENKILTKQSWSDPYSSKRKASDG